jgi:undecaprenyl diphosphate synthase
MPAIDPERLPAHVAIIMDGNGRWARQRTLNRVRGHEVGTESVREIVRTSKKIGIQWLTLYAFSEENWRRPKHEIKALMSLLKRFLKNERKEMMDNGIRFQTIGRIHKLPEDVQKTVRDTITATSKNEDMVLTLALSYGGRQELADAIRGIAERIESGAVRPTDIDEQLVSESLYTSGMPDPDLLIRTSGECRISNFLLWQLAYTEIYISPRLWPDFRKADYLHALEDYQTRERRFGATGDQLAV